jgi:hypothetical protein
MTTIFFVIPMNIGTQDFLVEIILPEFRVASFAFVAEDLTMTECFISCRTRSFSPSRSRYGEAMRDLRMTGKRMLMTD